MVSQFSLRFSEHHGEIERRIFGNCAPGQRISEFGLHIGRKSDKRDSKRFLDAEFLGERRA